MTTDTHNHGTDLYSASQCSAECLINARAANNIRQAALLERSKNAPAVYSYWADEAE